MSIEMPVWQWNQAMPRRATRWKISHFVLMGDFVATTVVPSASAKVVDNEINGALLGHFKIVPNEQDYIFGKGKPIYTWPGNAHY